MRRLFVGVLLLSLLAGACSSDSGPTVETSQTPLQSDAVAVGSLPLGVYGAGLNSGMVAAGAYAEFYADGTGRVRGLVGNSSDTLRLHESRFTYAIDGDQIEVAATTGDCDVGAIGRYRWSVEGPMLELTDPADGCGDRRDSLHGEWYSLGDTPVIEIDRASDPITIDSPIGSIVWRVVPGQRYAWWLGQTPDGEGYRPIVAIDAGFVAAVDEPARRAVDRALVFSPNGVNWQPIPPPPSSVGWIAADRKQLYVAPATAPDTVYVTADLGGTWTALPVVDPPGSVWGLHAGPAGVVLTGDATALWLLDGGSFVKAPPTPARFARVLSLDTGFFAWSADDIGDGSTMSYWRSDDARSWTEATGVPPDILDWATTNWGDNIYLSNWGDATGYTSMDGGRTWSESGMRPGEDLTVTEVGYFSVQPAIFGPAVGVVWMSSDDADWQRVVNPWPPLWTFSPVVSGNTILVPSSLDSPSGQEEHLDWVGHIVDPGQ